MRVGEWGMVGGGGGVRGGGCDERRRVGMGWGVGGRSEVDSPWGWVRALGFIPSRRGTQEA